MAKIKGHQHYIPRFYLKGFTEPNYEDYIWVYEKGKTEPIKLHIKNVAVQKHYYSFTDHNGEKNITIEDALAEIEGKTAPVFQKIKKHDDLNEDDRINFSYFLSTMITRVPNFRENMNNIYKDNINKAIEQIEPYIKNDKKNYVKPINLPEEFWNSMWNDMPEKAEEKLQDIYLKSDKKTVKPEITLKFLDLPREEPASIFNNMKWKFIVATDNWKFVTSDNPLHNYLDIGLLNKNVEVIFPVSKDLVFLGTWQDNKEGRYFQADNNTVKEFNRATVKSALKYVYSSNNSDGLMRLVQKYKDNAPKIQITQL
jgi:hypothetical protein